MFFFKTHAENELGRVGSLVPHPFLFFRKALYKLKTSTLVLIYFGRPGLRDTMTTNFIAVQAIDPEIYSNLIFYKRAWD